ncbi:uncharacterized protein LOC141679166 [Apium graveolens]|uniref:uncharacterized protein LOC141679166 n=1 Tax=Apium graveolens TaxID=4045 RepID=UPI003D7BF871
MTFEELKKYMVQISLLAKPVLNGNLYLYLAVYENTSSSVLVKEEAKIQKAIYHKLRPYFQAHKIEVLTNQPMRDIIHSPKASGRLIKWAIELGEFDIKYNPMTSIEAQTLADFMVKCIIDNQEVGGQEDIPQKRMEGEKKSEDKEFWVLCFDGALKSKSTRDVLVLQSADGFLIEYSMKLYFPIINNEAEYKTLIAGFSLAGTLRVKNLKFCGQSKLVVSQVNGEF